MMHRVFGTRILASAASSALTSPAPAAAAARNAVRHMSAGSRREGKDGIPVRRAGGMTLPGEDQVEVDGESRYKSRKQSERDEAVRERATGGASEPIDSKPYSGSNGAGAADPDSMSNSDFMNGSEEDHAILARMKKIDREELRPGEQSWRERQLTKAGIRQPASFRLKKKDELRMKQTPIGSAKYNPVLVRTREHINSSDLPPSFDHFKVPPLSADEIDQKQKDLHATYWNKYAAWKDARPEEYQRWLARLEKREEEQSFHWQQSQLPPKKRLAALKNQMDSKLLPEKNRNDFEEALKNDSTLKDAVEKLGRNEVLRRWSAYQVFLDAEIAAETRERNVMHSAKKKIQRDQALNAEDAITTLNDPNLNLNVTQKKKLYHLMLGAKTRVNEVPFWTDPDPRFEGEHDWKMADAFIKPPLLPPLHLLREYSARPEVNSNFSSLHKFLHFERLRQTVQFLREHKKKVVRDGKRLLEFNPSTYVETLISDTKDWSKITQDYPFLSDILLSGAQNLYRSPWPHADQKAFLTALHKNLLTIAQLLDVHFSRRNRNAAWILPFPNNPTPNPDDVLRPMTSAQVKRMEAELLAGQMLNVLQGQQEETTTSTPVEETKAEPAPLEK